MFEVMLNFKSPLVTHLGFEGFDTNRVHKNLSQNGTKSDKGKDI